MLNCKNCGKDFEYSQIGASLTDYFFPAKPEVGSEGRLCRCPHCKSEIMYKQRDLTYFPAIE